MTSEDCAPTLAKGPPVLFHSIDRNGNLVEVCDHWLDALGYRREEVIGRKSTEFLTETSRRYAENFALPRFFKTGYCTDLPYQYVTRSGEVLDVLLSATAERNKTGEVVRARAVLRDVTGLKGTEKAHREEIYSRAFRASGAILVISTLAGGIVVEVNEAFECVTGYRREEVLGLKGAQLNLWESEKEREKYAQILREQGRVHNVELRLRSKGGRTIIGLLSGEIIDLGGEKCMLSVINDITEHKRASEEIEVLHTNLAAHARQVEIANEELEAFSYTVSHDLRKPLTAIGGYAQVLLELCTSDKQPECKDFLHDILAGAFRMSELIDTLLEFSKAGRSEVHRMRVDLSAMAADAAEELRASDPQRKVRLEIEEGVVAEGDPALLRVVLDNLIGNAWKYTAREEEAVIGFASTQFNGSSVYFVRDNGVGFDNSGAESIFSAFHRQKGAEEFQGFGIGLATVARIIKRHGGRVWAEGAPGAGATFYFTVE